MKLAIIAILAIALAYSGAVSGIPQEACGVDGICYCSGTLVDCSFLLLEHIPTNIPATTTALYLNSNKFTSLSANSFATLSNLETLDLADNLLSSIDSDAFADLTDLIDLQLGYNLLTSIPVDAFVHIPNLQFLYLNDNSITSISSDAFIALRNLRILLLESNQITSIGPDAFAGLIGLHRLFLQNNLLTTLPPGLFYRLYSLNSFFLANNDFEVAPPSTYGSNEFPSFCHFSCWTCSGEGPAACTACADDKLPVSGSCAAVENSVSNFLAGITLDFSSEEVFSSPLLQADPLPCLDDCNSATRRCYAIIPLPAEELRRRSDLETLCILNTPVDDYVYAGIGTYCDFFHESDEFCSIGLACSDGDADVKYCWFEKLTS